MPERGRSVPGARLSGRGRRLVLDGDCLEVLPWCEGMCCRMEWDIPLTTQEYASGSYDAEQACALSNDSCREKAPACPHRGWRLRKRGDGACVHLQDNKCSIYADRPQVCRNFTCKGGWRIAASVFPPDGAAGVAVSIGKEQFLARLKDDQVFVRHPLVKLLSLFHLKEKKTVVLVTRLAGSCGQSAIHEPFFNPDLDEEDLCELLTLFDSKDSLGAVRLKFTTRCGRRLGRSEFAEVVWLLTKSRIIAEACVFNGTLAGTHRASG